MDLSNINLLVTGGCGFIGSNFCLKIHNFLNKLIIIDKLSYASSEKSIQSILSDSVILIKEDISIHDFHKTFNKYNINYIIHFAAQTHVDNSYKFFNDFITDNIISTQILLESIKNYSSHITFLHFSTDEIYGTSTNDIPFNESSNFNPTNPYAASKASAEMIVNTYKSSFNLPIIITRCNNVYGPFQFTEKVIPCFITNALLNKELPIHGKGNHIRDFIYIDDVVSAVLTIMHKGQYGEIYNIGNNNPINILSLANIIINRIGYGTIKYIQDRPFNDSRYLVNTDKLISLGWSPSISFEEGLNYTIQWISNNLNYFETTDFSNNFNNCNSFNDLRGTLLFIPINIIVKQQFISINHKNVIRGIHTSPYGKLVTCLKGKFIDYIINLDTLTYKKYTLGDTIKQLYVPPNHGHCFVSLEDDSTLLYQLEGFYNETLEKNYNIKCPYINLDIEPNEYIISDKDKSFPFFKPIDYIVLGANGFLGNETVKILKNQNKNYITIDTRLQHVDLLKQQLLFYKPKYVISAAGISGRPTVHWCDDNIIETISNNLTYQLTLTDICHQLNIHLTIYISGLLYDSKLCQERFIETDHPNKRDQFYSTCRTLLEYTITYYPNVLGLRILYPISFTSHPKCFLNKMILRKNSVNNTLINSTIIPDLFPKITSLIQNNVNGIFNFVNDNPINIANILDIYIDKCDNNFDYNLVQNQHNSYCLLDISKLKSFIDVMDTKDAIEKYINNKTVIF
jgi:dTDP-glucose 4,6-dehydratase